MKPEDVIPAILGMGHDRCERPLTVLRYVRRNGELVLQYPFEWHEGLCGGVEWRDVPVEDETP